jgi:hypothetical protein
MSRTIVIAGLVLALSVASSPGTSATAAGTLSRIGSSGPLSRLNKPLVPGLPTMPGLPTFSPLGLLSPRLSNLESIRQFGGLRSQDGRLAGIGVLSPRISPVVAMVQGVPDSRAERLLYGLTVLSPRAATLVGMLRAAQGFAIR